MKRSTSSAHGQSTSAQVNGPVIHEAAQPEPKVIGQPDEVNPFTAMRAINRLAMSSQRVLMLLAIADHAGFGRACCTASYQTLANGTNISRRHAIRLVQELAEAGLIKIEFRHTRDAGNIIHLGMAFFDALHAQEEREGGKRPRVKKLRAAIQPAPTSDKTVTSTGDITITSTGDRKTTPPTSDKTVTSTGDKSSIPLVTNRVSTSDSVVTQTNKKRQEEENPPRFSSSNDCANDRPDSRSGLPSVRPFALNSDGGTPPPEPTAASPPSDDDSVDESLSGDPSPDEWLESVLGEQRAHEAAARIEREQKGREKCIELRMREERAKAKQVETLEAIRKHAAQHPEAKP